MAMEAYSRTYFLLIFVAPSEKIRFCHVWFKNAHTHKQETHTQIAQNRVKKKNLDFLKIKLYIFLHKIKF